MGMIPDSNNNREQVWAVIADGCKKKIAVRDQNGNITYETVLDEKRAWYKTGIVPSPHYGNYSKDVEDFRNLADQAYKFTPADRAAALAQDILLEYDSFCSSIDAMSSMTLRDNHNSQACLIDKGFRQKSERDIRILEEGKRSFMDAFTGKKKEETLYD